MTLKRLYPGEVQLQKWDRELAALHRRINRQPEPVPEKFQEQFLAALYEDGDFRRAVHSLLKEVDDE